MHLGPILIKRGEAGQLIVRVPYTRERVAKIKTIVGRRWHQSEKCWSVPHTDSTLRHLLALFAGEPVELEPSLRPVNVSGMRQPSHEPVSDHVVATNLKLVDHVRQAIRTRHYSYRTEEAYVGWIRRFLMFHDQRDPAEIGAVEVSRFLTSLAVDRRVASSTQNQALTAILFLYKDVLDQDPGWLDEVVRAKRPRRLPVVLTRQEVQALLAALDGVSWIMGTLLYGSGLRLMECLRLRVKDVDIGRGEVLVREGKGDKDRVTMLPTAVVRGSMRISNGSARSMRLTWRQASDASRFPMPWHANTHRRTANGGGSGSFPPRPSRPTRARASGAGITSTSPSRSGPSVKPDAESGSRRRLGRTRCATASPRICWKRATTFVRSRNSSATVT
jgi:integrase